MKGFLTLDYKQEKPTIVLQASTNTLLICCVTNEPQNSDTYYVCIYMYINIDHVIYYIIYYIIYNVENNLLLHISLKDMSYLHAFSMRYVFICLLM